MKAAGHDVRRDDPFAEQQTFGSLQASVPAIVGRLQAFWSSLREQVIEGFPKAPGLPKDTDAYLKFINEIYQSDAYHSLSIEGYRVTPELIDRVRAGKWNPEAHEADRKNRDALAARVIPGRGPGRRYGDAAAAGTVGAPTRKPGVLVPAIAAFNV